MLQFSTGEFDIGVFDPESASCRIFEIKPSTAISPQQIRHLIDEEKCTQTEHRYGKIERKYMLYRGEAKIINGIQYINAEEYLRNPFSL